MDARGIARTSIMALTVALLVTAASAQNLALDVPESRYINSRGYTHLVRSASFPTIVNGILARFALVPRSHTPSANRSSSGTCSGAIGRSRRFWAEQRT
jgi:hypothetical protein